MRYLRRPVRGLRVVPQCTGVPAGAVSARGWLGGAGILARSVSCSHGGLVGSLRAGRGRDVRGEGAVSVRGEGAFAVATCLSADALLGRHRAHASRHPLAAMRLLGALPGGGLTKARRWCGLGVHWGLATGIADALRRLFLVQGCGGVKEPRDESHGPCDGSERRKQDHDR